jgi:hypothetical protein
MRVLWVVVLVVGLAACATQPIMLKNAKTGQVTQCGPYTNMHPFFPGLSPHGQAERDCISDFQRQGFERMPTTP